MEKKRIEWVDMSKGFAIILVMVGHLPNALFPVNIWLYTFHVPLFFFLSGYVFNVEKYAEFKNFFVSKIKTLLIPMVFMGLMNGVWLLLLEPFNGIKTILYRVIGCFVQLRGSQFDSGLWFVVCLFVTEIVYWLIWKITKGKENYIAVLLLIGSVVGYVYVRFIHYIVPWSLEVALVAVGFFGCGNLLKQNRKYIDKVCSLKWLPFLIVASVGSTYFNYRIGSSVDLYANQMGIYPLFYLGAFAGILMSITIYKLVNNSIILSYVGKNSLVFYAFHISCFQTINKLLDTFSLKLPQNLEWAAYIVITICVLFVITEIIHRYAPWILGRFQNKEKSIL